MKLDEIKWKQGKVDVWENGVIIYGLFGETLTVPNAELTDLIFTLANIEQDRALRGMTGENNA